MATRKFSRREIVRILGGGAAGISVAALLQACRAAPPSSSPAAATVAPVESTGAATHAGGSGRDGRDDSRGRRRPIDGPDPVQKRHRPGAATPKRGGTMTTALLADWTAWDPTQAQAIRVGHMFFTSNKLIQGDWTKGPQGNGTTTWEWGYVSDDELLTGELAESWETPDPTTIIYHLRKGVKFHNKPPVNGRELTADDVVWNINMQLTYPTAWRHGVPRELRAAADGGQGARQIHGPGHDAGGFARSDAAGDRLQHVHQSARGVGERRRHVRLDQGDRSGPWMITNYVAGSEITLSRTRITSRWTRSIRPAATVSGHAQTADHSGFLVAVHGVADGSDRLAARARSG